MVSTTRKKRASFPGEAFFSCAICPEMEGWGFTQVLGLTLLIIAYYKLTFMIVKAILRDVMGEEKFYFSTLFIHLCNDPCHRILSPQCIHAE